MRLVWFELDDRQGSILVNPECVIAVDEGDPDGPFCVVYVQGKRKPYQVRGTLERVGQALMTGKMDRVHGCWVSQGFPDWWIQRKPPTPGERAPVPKMVPCRLVPPADSQP